jgi:hypothetical protein
MTDALLEEEILPGFKQAVSIGTPPLSSIRVDLRKNIDGSKGLDQESRFPG